MLPVELSFCMIAKAWGLSMNKGSPECPTDGRDDS
jgi:hypothetical protein